MGAYANGGRDRGAAAYQEKDNTRKVIAVPVGKEEQGRPAHPIRSGG